MILNGNNDRQGVIKTPCLFYFGCYIDTLCGRTLRNRMSGAAARHFFFLEKVRTMSACIGINLPLKKRPAIGGGKPTPPRGAPAAPSAGNSQRRRGRRWRKHSVCMTTALAGACPSPQCRLRAESFAVSGRRKEQTGRAIKTIWYPHGSPRRSVRSSGSSALCLVCQSAPCCGNSFPPAPARRAARTLFGDQPHRHEYQPDCQKSQRRIFHKG